MEDLQYNYILFDADQTLFDFKGSARTSFKSTIKFLGIEFHNSIFEKYLKINTLVWSEFERGEIQKSDLVTKRWQWLVQEYPFCPKISAINKYYLTQLVENATLIPGALELLDQLKRKNVSLTMITNGFKEVQRPRVLKTGIHGYFEFIMVSDEIGKRKPNCDFFKYVLNKINVSEQSKILIVGDNIHSDIKGGNDMGLHTCWYNPGRLSNSTDIVPTYEVTDYEELLKVIGI